MKLARVFASVIGLANGLPTFAADAPPVPVVVTTARAENLGASLTATGTVVFLRGIFHSARCTWPMLAAAAGRSSNSAKCRCQSLPSCSASTLWTVAAGSGGAASCSLMSASR